MSTNVRLSHGTRTEAFAIEAGERSAGGDRIMTVRTGDEVEGQALKISDSGNGRFRVEAGDGRTVVVHVEDLSGGGKRFRAFNDADMEADADMEQDAKGHALLGPDSEWEVALESDDDATDEANDDVIGHGDLARRAKTTLYVIAAAVALLIATAAPALAYRCPGC